MSLLSAGIRDARLDPFIKERYSRHNVGKEFSLGLLEYENARPMFDINEVRFYFPYMRF